MNMKRFIAVIDAMKIESSRNARNKVTLKSNHEK